MPPIIEKYWKEFIIAILVITIIILGALLFNRKEKILEESSSNEISYLENSDEQKEEVRTKIKVDIKGAIAKPGVYELDSNSVVNDVIKLAGGLKKGADTSNINLSKELENEMVIKVFTASELKKQTKTKEIASNDICQENTIIIDKCNDSSIIKDVNTPNSNDVIQNTETKDNNKAENNLPKLISINTATVEELTSLPGIGESKALNIVKYREEHGLFKTTEEIMNVSGIGEAAYQKIKENITI